MGLQETFRKAAQQTVAAFGDVAVSTNYLAHTSTTFDVSAGTPTSVFTTVAGVKVIFEEFQITEIDNVGVKPEDKRALIAAKDISTVTPNTEDRIKQVSTIWEVVGVRTDPATALWQLQVRKP